LCKIPITTPTQRFPQKLEPAPQPACHAAETASAAMQSRGTQSRRDLQRLGQSKSSAHFLNCLGRILFQNRCIAGCVLLQRPCNAQ
jgi:hypothetical protein